MQYQEMQYEKIQQSEKNSRPELRWIIFLASALSIFASVAYISLPGIGKTTILSWQSSDKNMIAPAVHYTPKELLIQANCKDLASAPNTRLLTTVPATELTHGINNNAQQIASQALIINKTEISGIIVSSHGEKLLSIDPNSCQFLQILFKKNEITIDTDQQPYKVTGEYLPNFIGFFRPINTPEYSGLRAQTMLNNNFQQTPALYKGISGIIAVLSVLITCIALIFCYKNNSKKKPLKFADLTEKNPWIVTDIIVILALEIWHFIGANTADDGYILTMASQRSSSGYDPNYYRWFGAGESPFGWFYAIYSILAHLSLGSYWLRIPELILGIVSWLLLAHAILPKLRKYLNFTNNSTSNYALTRWGTAAVFLLYWFTYNNGLRPENVIAFGITLTIWLALLATQKASLALSYLTFIASAFTLACGPTGIIVIVPVTWLILNSSVTLEKLAQVLKLHKRKSVISWGCIIVISGLSSVIPVAFYFLSLDSFIRKTIIQITAGPSFSWYEEFIRYNLLFSYSADGSMPRRMTVVSVIIALGYLSFSVFSVRVKSDNQIASQSYTRSVAGIIIATLASFLLLAPTPTKPTHHLGALTPIAIIAVSIALTIAGEIKIKNQAGAAGIISLILFLTAIAFTGPNKYWYISSSNILWSNRPIRFGKSVGTEFLILAIIFAAIAVIYYLRSQYTNILSQFPPTASVKKTTQTLEVLVAPQTANTSEPQEEHKKTKKQKNKKKGYAKLAIGESEQISSHIYDDNDSETHDTFNTEESPLNYTDNLAPSHSNAPIRTEIYSHAESYSHTDSYTPANSHTSVNDHNDPNHILSLDSSTDHFDSLEEDIPAEHLEYDQLADTHHTIDTYQEQELDQQDLDQFVSANFNNSHRTDTPETSADTIQRIIYYKKKPECKKIYYISQRVFAIILIFTTIIEFTSFAIPAVYSLFKSKNSPYSIAKGNFHAIQGRYGNLGLDLYGEVPEHWGILPELDKNDITNIGMKIYGYSKYNVPGSLFNAPEDQIVAEVSTKETAKTVPPDGSIYEENPHLPYGLPQTLPYTGNYSAGYTKPTEKYRTGWYPLTAFSSVSPLLVVTVAGNASDRISAEFTDDIDEPEKCKGIQYCQESFIDTYPGQKWRNIVIDLQKIHYKPKYIRLVVDSVPMGQWIVFTAPRIPLLRPIESIIGADPVLVDWSAGLAFPTLHQLTIEHGIQQVPKWRILPDRSLIKTNTEWESVTGGGPLGLIDSYNKLTVWPVYPIHQLGQEYGAIEQYQLIISASPPQKDQLTIIREKRR